MLRELFPILPSRVEPSSSILSFPLHADYRSPLNNRTVFPGRQNKVGRGGGCWRLCCPSHSRWQPHEGISKSFRICRLERGLQMVQRSATRCSYIAILWVSLASFAAITLCAASQRVFIVVSVYFVRTQSGNFWLHPRIPSPFLLHSKYGDLWPVQEGGEAKISGVRERWGIISVAKWQRTWDLFVNMSSVAVCFIDITPHH
jgi:hypothetical protein